VSAKRRGGGDTIIAGLLVALILGFAIRAAANPLTVTSGVILNEEYNDNVHFDNHKEDDYITTLAVGVHLLYQTPASTTSLATGVGGSYFARKTAASVNLAQGQRLLYSTTYQYSPQLSFSISDGLARVGSRARGLNSDAGVDTSTTAQNLPQVNQSGINVLLPRGTAFTNFFSATSSYLLSPRWAAAFSVTNGVSTFSDPNSTDVSYGLGPNVSYRLSEDLSLNSGYTYSRFYNSNAPDSEGHTATVGATYTPAPLWSVFGSVGGSVNLPTGNSNQSTRTSATFSVGMDRQFATSSLAIAVQQGLTPSAGVAGTSNTLGGYVYYTIFLTDHLTGLLDTSYTNYDTTSGSFSVYQGYATLRYAIWRQVSAGFVYAYRRSDANQGLSNVQHGVVDQNIVLIQIGTTFDLWRLDV